ncbi:MAG: substrate-binding domain-containing protein [Thaumarchaeota archaeon]|nr:substrate-binding domain-containing protein [Nitrososphaerota archaeon]
MRSERRGVSPMAYAAVVVIILVVVAAAGYAAYGVRGMTSTVTVTNSVPTTMTSTVTTTSLTTVTSTPTTSMAAAPLIAFSADAYAAETQALLNGFSSSTGAQIAPLNAGGSFADANKIAAGAPDDVFISSSLAATGSGYLKNLTANWSIGFASDQFVVAYTNASLNSSPAAMAIVNAGNTAIVSNSSADWNNFYTLLTSGSVKIGIANPVLDPAGVRGWLVLEAAGSLYSGANQMAYTAPLLQAGANVTVPNSAALVAPLKAGQVQFIMTYLSSAFANHLNYLVLDRHISLGDPTLASFYLRFYYKDSAGTTTGSPIILSVTIPRSSVNANEALQFAQYVIKNAGILTSYGLRVFSPARLYSNVAVPQPIAELVSQGLIIQAGSLP